VVRFTRRNFLKVAGISSLSLTLGSCRSNSATLISSPTIDSHTPTPPEQLATPTVTPNPTIAPTLTSVPSPKTDMTALRGLAEKLGMEVGVLLMPDVPEALDVQESQFNFGTLTSNWNYTEAAPGSFDFGWVDDQLLLAEKSRMKARFHSLFHWGTYPAWLINGNFTSSEIIDKMKLYAETLVLHFETRFPGIITQYVVVNEPTHGQVDDFLYNVLGEDYIKIAFDIARQATLRLSPSPQLLYNHNKNHATADWNGTNFELTLKDVEALKTEGTIDGVGVQAHLRASVPPDKSDMIKAFKAYGIPVNITECDVSLVAIDGTTEHKYAIQAEVYHALIEAVLDSEVCKNVTFWGVGDQYSWLEQPDHKQNRAAGPDSDPTLFDDQLQPKPGYYAIFNALREYLANQ
jgi:endo-1,4-beta-xylanase